MAITFGCEGCGKSYTVRDEMAGKTGRCKACGHQMRIPAESDSDGYGMEQAEPEPEPESLPPRVAPSRTTPRRRPPFDAPGAGARPEGKGFFSFGKTEVGGLIGGLIMVAGLGLWAYTRWERTQARQAMARMELERRANPAPATDWTRPSSSPRPGGPGLARIPAFPEPGPAREVEPGVSVREVALGPPAPGKPPGWSGKLWVYLPPGEHAPGSLPCILITGAGSNLLTGMELAEGDVAEHAPYVRAGYAVVAFELDGMLRDRQAPGAVALTQAMGRFLAAQAGLVNARVAFAYATTKLPAVDPARISVAGHSSAGTLALLYAEDEPRLRSCIAYAPAPDVEEHFRRNVGPEFVQALRDGGAAALLGPLSPRTNEAKLDRPLFLFYARDDHAVPELDAFAARLKAMNKPTTVVTVPGGGHHEPMIRQGIPAAIAWLVEQEKGGR